MRRTIGPVVFLNLLIVALAGCNDNQALHNEVNQAKDPSVVQIAPEFLKRLAIVPASEGWVAETMRVPARVEVNEHRMARVGSAVTGRVTEIHAYLGQAVKRGDVLTTLNSTELSDAQLAYLKALSDEGLQRRAVERAKLLFAADVIGEAELQKRQADLVQAQAELHASYEQLKVLGMSKIAINKLASSRRVHSVSTINSTLDGVVIERKVTPGQVVQPADILYTVADLSHVWLVAEVTEQDALLVKMGEVVQAEVPALGGKRFEGRLIYIADIVDPDRRTVTVRMDVENKERLLKPEMLASMLILGQPQRQLVVPASAVVREENKDYVFVQLDNQRFQLRRIQLGPEVHGFSPVQGGIKTGERIVIDGAFHLNNERKRAESGS